MFQKNVRKHVRLEYYVWEKIVMWIYVKYFKKDVLIKC